MSPQLLGSQAYRNGINAPCMDIHLTQWLANNTSGKVGTARIHYENWYKGFYRSQDKDLALIFPELYPHLFLAVTAL